MNFEKPENFRLLSPTPIRVHSLGPNTKNNVSSYIETPTEKVSSYPPHFRSNETKSQIGGAQKTEKDFGKVG